VGLAAQLEASPSCLGGFVGAGVCRGVNEAGATAIVALLTSAHSRLTFRLSPRRNERLPLSNSLTRMSQNRRVFYSRIDIFCRYC